MHGTNASKFSCLATILPIILGEKSEVKEVKEISAKSVSDLQMFTKHSRILRFPYLLLMSHNYHKFKTFYTLWIIHELLFKFHYSS